MNFVTLWLLLRVSYVLAALNDSMSPWREAKSVLKSQILSHRAVRGKLCPASDHSKVQLLMNFKAYEALSSDDIEQSFTTVSYFELSWRDNDLAWDPTEYQGIQHLSFSYSDLWHPVIVVANSADHERMVINPMNDQLLVSHEGFVSLRTGSLLKTTCSIDLTLFPMDVQDCEIVLLPFMDECEFNISVNDMDNITNPINLTGEWEILSQTLTVSNYQPASNTIIPTGRVNFRIQRSSLFYVVNVIAPMVLTTLMTSFVFLIPPNSGEKVSFVVTIFVSNAVFLNFIAGILPRSMTMENIPKLVFFILVVMVESFLALTATLFVMRKYNSERKDKEKRSEAKLLKKFTELLKSKNQVGNITSSKIEDDNLVDRAFEEKSLYPEMTSSKLGSFRELLFHLVKKSKLTSQQAGKKAQGVKKCCVKCFCCIRARHWDIFFFFIFTALSAAFYVMLIVIPSPFTKDDMSF